MQLFTKHKVKSVAHSQGLKDNYAQSCSLPLLQYVWASVNITAVCQFSSSILSARPGGLHLIFEWGAPHLQLSA